MPLSQTSLQDASGAITVSGEGADGASAPALTIQVGGKDPSGNLQTILTDTTGIVQVGSKIPLTPASPTSFSVGVASAVAVAFNANRKGLILTNVSTAHISFGLGVAAVLNSGVTLYPGGVWVMDEFNFTIDSVTAIASLAASALAVQEFNT